MTVEANFRRSTLSTGREFNDTGPSWDPKGDAILFTTGSWGVVGRGANRYTPSMDILRPPVFSFLCLIVCCGIASACSADGGTKDHAERTACERLPVHQLMKYSVRYMGLTCGEMSLESHREDLGGVPVYHIVMHARNSKFFNRIYKISVQIESWVDARKLGTIRYISRSVEKGREHEERIEVRDDEVIWLRKGKEGHFDLAPGSVVLDPLAFIYRLQSYASSPGARPELLLLTTKGPLPAISQVSGLMKEKTAFGKRKVVQIHPRPADGKMFSRKGDFTMWVEPGSPPLLQLLDFDLSFGRLKVRLVKRAAPK